jgi:hypothetical protein
VDTIINFRDLYLELPPPPPPPPQCFKKYSILGNYDITHADDGVMNIELHVGGSSGSTRCR